MRVTFAPITIDMVGGMMPFWVVATQFANWFANASCEITVPFATKVGMISFIIQL